MSTKIYTGNKVNQGRLIHDSGPDIKIYPILKFPDPILSARAEEVTVFDEDLMNLIGDMWATLNSMKWGRAVGLAAPQIGKSIQLFIAEGAVYINPKVTWVTKAPKQVQREGCYSGIVNDFKDVHRYTSIRMNWVDQHGKPHSGRFNGFKARVIQHELDHLNIDWENGL